jgi:dolichol-phosphate mannosyltransferase
MCLATASAEEDTSEAGSNAPAPAQKPASCAPRLSLIIPTLREASNIRPLLLRVRAALDSCDIPYEVIVVDDESRDGIDAIVAELACEDPRIRLIVRNGEHGLAGAVLRGWAETDAAHLAVMDADLQHPPELLPQLWAALDAGADLVVGSRYARGGSLGGWNTLRHLISRTAVWMTLPVQRAGMRARDPMSGFFMVRRSCIDGIALQKSGFKILLEILARGEIRSVVEVPFVFGRRYAGASKANLRVAFEYLLLLLRLYRQKGQPPTIAEREAHPDLEVSQRVVGS